MIYYQFNLWKIFQQNAYFDRIIIPIFSIHLGHYTSENVYQKKFVQSKWLLYFGKYGYGAELNFSITNIEISVSVTNASNIWSVSWLYSPVFP